MTDIYGAAKLALEALEVAVGDGAHDYQKYLDAITAIKQARSAPVQEPVGYADSRDLAKDGNWDTFIVKHKNEMREGLRFNVPLYCYPIKATQRQWVGLNAEDLSEIPPTAYEGAIWADAKLREKNT